MGKITDDPYYKEQLHFAAQEGDLKTVKELVHMGYRGDEFDDLALTPLHYAVMKEHFDVVQFLLETGIDINIKNSDMIGETPLTQVAGTCSYKMAKYLIDRGANPNAEGWMKITAIARARQRDNVEAEAILGLFGSCKK